MNELTITKLDVGGVGSFKVVERYYVMMVWMHVLTSVRRQKKSTRNKQLNLKALFSADIKC